MKKEELLDITELWILNCTSSDTKKKWLRLEKK